MSFEFLRILNLNNGSLLNMPVGQRIEYQIDFSSVSTSLPQPRTPDILILAY